MEGAAIAARGPDARAPSAADLVPWLLTVRRGPVELEVVPVEDVVAEPSGVIRMSGRGHLFDVVATWTPGRCAVTCWDVSVDVRAHADEPVEAGVVVGLRLASAADPRWLIPGLFYGENRPLASRSRYPRWAADDADPFTARAWSFRSDRAATPAVLASAGGLVAVLATTESSPVGPTGLAFRGGGPGGDPVEIQLCFPYREEPLVYDGSGAPSSPDLPTHRWLPGETVRLSLRAYVGADDDRARRDVLRDLHGWLAPGGEHGRVPWVGLDDAATLAAHGLLRWHYHESQAAIFETAAFERHGDGRAPEPGDRAAMHVGWLSGAPPAAALLAHGLRTGRRDATDAARRVVDAIATNLAPCGTFWGQWSAERGWGKGWTPGDDVLHARTIAEATLFMARAAAVLPDPAAAERWRGAVASNVAFVVDRQRDDGAIPSGWNGRTGDPTGWDGTAGLAWVPALVEGGRLLDAPPFLDAAARAGAFYESFVERGDLRGAPEDVDLGPTSEDGYVALMAYVALAEAAHAGGERDRWIATACRAADWLLTFRYAYDVAFPPDTLLAEYRYRTRGMDLASPANQHLHSYGLVCVAELVRLTRLTGDDHYATRAREHLAAARQFIARSDGDFNARRGMAPERFFQTRYDGPKGSIGSRSHAWCLGLLLWACEQARVVPELADGS
jgi:hypothetical protein